MKKVLLPVLMLAALAALGAYSYLAAYPGGTPQVVTNATPYCANCHSSVGTEQLRDRPADMAARLVAEARHFTEISAGEEGYSKLSKEDRDKLIEQIKEVDSNCKVSVALSSASVKPGGALTATVTTHGGAGPVIGVMLTDIDLRFECSPIQAGGFLITAPPQVTGPDGKAQTAFLDGRFAGLSKNINYVNIQGVKSDVTTKTYPECKVVYSLKAPMQPGEYTVTAAFMYGTEKATPLGTSEGPGGRKMPLGGQGAHSGRIQFAKVMTLKVG
jgi:hypothetical protein